MEGGERVVSRDTGQGLDRGDESAEYYALHCGFFVGGDLLLRDFRAALGAASRTGLGNKGRPPVRETAPN